MSHTELILGLHFHKHTKNCKAIPMQSWTDPEGFRRLKLPDFQTAHEGCKVVRPKHRPS
jgi:hypothetical protein